MLQVKIYCNNIRGSSTRAEWATTLPVGSPEDIHSLIKEAELSLRKERYLPNKGDPNFRILASVTTIKKF